jgi:Cu(I)-responsive transcriptional regulator
MRVIGHGLIPRQAEAYLLRPIARLAKPFQYRKVKKDWKMNIGAASAASGVSAKMIRHYEAIGLLRPAPRRSNSYRDYESHDVHELRFIGRARKLGFSMAEIGALLALWRDTERPSREVKVIAGRHLAGLERRIVELQGMAGTLRKLMRLCHGDDRPECPILDDLGGETRRGAAARTGSVRAS